MFFKWWSNGISEKQVHQAKYTYFRRYYFFHINAKYTWNNFVNLLWKAFDSVNWNFLFKTFEKINFGKNYINYVKTIYNKIEATVLNNGSTSSYFELERRVRQGCPLWAYLFLVVIETLANKIGNDKTIEDIRIDKKEIKISFLTDNITLLQTNLKSLK